MQTVAHGWSERSTWVGYCDESSCSTAVHKSGFNVGPTIHLPMFHSGTTLSVFFLYCWRGLNSTSVSKYLLRRRCYKWLNSNRFSIMLLDIMLEWVQVVKERQVMVSRIWHLPIQRPAKLCTQSVSNIDPIGQPRIAPQSLDS